MCEMLDRLSSRQLADVPEASAEALASERAGS